MVVVVWALPRFCLVCCFLLTKRKSGWGICGSSWLLALVCLLVDLDLPAFMDQLCPCTNVFLTAYSHVRTEPLSDIGQTRGKKNRLAKSITQLTLCQVTTSEVDAATKLLDKACQKLQGIQNIPSQRVTDLEAAIRQLRQISCILDSCTISASYEVSQAQKAILLLPHTAKGASTSSEELNAQISPRTDDEYNLPYHEDYWQED